MVENDWIRLTPDDQHDLMLLSNAEALAVARQLPEVKALVEAARAVNHTFYGMLLREWGVSENWPADAHGKVVYEQLRDILAQWEVSDG